MTLDPNGAQDFCSLTTNGRRTGNPHTIEIWFGGEGRTLFLLSGGGDDSDWVKNIRQDPAVRIRVGQGVWDATARVVADSREDAAARRLLAAKYQGWHEGEPMTEWARTATPIALDLSASPVESP